MKKLLVRFSPLFAIILSSCGLINGKAEFYSCYSQGMTFKISDCNDIGVGLAGPIVECIYENRSNSQISLDAYVKVWSFDSEGVRMGSPVSSLTGQLSPGERLKDRSIYYSGASKVVFCDRAPVLNSIKKI